MKTNLLSCLILSFLILSFSSCNSKKALEDKINETIAEKMVGAGMGTEVEASNLANADKAKAEVDVKLNGTSIGFENSMPDFLITQGKNSENVSVSCRIVEVKGNQDEMRNIEIGFGGKKSLFKTPLTAEITTKDNENQVKASFYISKLTQNGIEMKMTNSGTLKIISFSDEEVVFEIDAKGEEMNESKTPFSFVGKIVCKNPVMTFMGLKKEDLFN